MSAWEKALACGIYTVSPLHVSTGQAEGAIDLPVVKEPHTGFPVIPASSLKGVARDALEGIVSKDELNRLFGPTVEETTGAASKAAGDQDRAASLFAGALVFTEARLVAYAVRSLNRPFLYVTSRLVLERLARDLKAAKIDLGQLSLPADGAPVLVADPVLTKTLVLEDLVYTKDIAKSSDVEKIGKALTALLPASEVERTSRWLEKSLVVIPDQDFAMLARRLPVRARIRLDENKTTNSDRGGNLWYEEQVPSDCLFVSLVGARRGRGDALQLFHKHRSRVEVTQIGGNETVGEGICFWTLAAQATANAKRV